MNVLVCVKRVPVTGGRIVLTDDAQEIDTHFLGFTVSPHEECAAEEAVRLVEAHGGSSAVLTLGPPEAEEQLRDAMAIGVDRGIHLRTAGEEWDGRATAVAIVDVVRAQEAGGGWEVFDVPLPAVLTVKEGINLPRYPSMPGRLKAKKKPVEAIEPGRARNDVRKNRLRLPGGQDKHVEVLGQGADAVPAAVEVLRRLGVVG